MSRKASDSKNSDTDIEPSHYVGVDSLVTVLNFDRDTKLVKFGVKLKMMTRQKLKKVVMISVCRRQKLKNFLQKIH